MMVGDLGFPIAVASFVLIRLNGKVGKLADAMHRLADALDKHNERTDRIERRLEHLEYQERREGGC